jgi:hypothetical protein
MATIVHELANPDQAAAWMNDLENRLSDLHERANVCIDEELTRRAELVGVKSGDRTVASIKAGQLGLKKPNANEKTKMEKGSVKYLGPYVVMKIAGDALHIKDLITNMSEKVKSSTCRIYYDKHGSSILHAK